MKPIIYMCGLAVMVLLVAGAAGAATVDDDTGDVFHWRWSENLGRYSWAHAVTDKPNVDITELSYDVSGETLTLSMTVQGTIEDDDGVWYWAYYNTSDATYTMYYVNGSGTAFGQGGSSYTTGNVTVSSSSISASIDLLGSDTRVEFYGWAASGYTGEDDAEYWQDWAPNDYGPDVDDDNGGGGDDDGDGGTPGFTALLALGGIAAVLLALRKLRR